MTRLLYQGRQEWLRPWPDGLLPTRNEVAARALIVHEGRILLAYEETNKTWFTPGGRIAPGESLMQGLDREIAEETGLAVNTGDLLCFFDVLIPHRQSHKFEFIFAAHPVHAPDWIERAHEDGDPSGSPVTKLRWFTPDEAAELTNVFPTFIRNFTSLLAPRQHTRSYFGSKHDGSTCADTQFTEFYISARCIALHEDKVLMVRNHGSDYWYGAGGRIEFGEPLFETAAREVLEESGLNATPESVIAVDEYFWVGNKAAVQQINIYTRCLLTSTERPKGWQDIGSVAESRLFSAEELRALPRAYPSYMAELAWPTLTNSIKETA